MKITRNRFFIFIAFLAFSVWPLYSADQSSGHPPAVPPRAEITVSVKGEVVRQGEIKLPEGATVLDALAAAGGATEWANVRKARLVRKNAGGDETIIVDLRNMREGKAAATPLREGDRLILQKVIIPF